MNKITGIALLLLLYSCSPVKKYAKTSAHWENEISALTQDKDKDYSENSILFLGSSSIRLWDNIEKDMSPFPVIKKGFGGANLRDVLVYENRLVNPYSCKAIVVFVANDIYGGKDDRSPHQILKLYKQLVKSIRKEHKTQPIFWVQVTPTASRWHLWEKVQVANLLIENYSKRQKNLYYIETAPAFLGPDGRAKPELFRSDKLHLTQEGYDIWAAIIKEALNKTLN